MSKPKRPAKTEAAKKPAAGSRTRAVRGRPAGPVRDVTRSPASVPLTPVFSYPGTLSERIMWICLHLMIFLVPLVIANYTWLGLGRNPLTFDQFDIIKVFVARALTLVAVGAWGWAQLTRGGRIRRSPVYWLVLGFLGWVVVSSIFSIHPATAIFGKYQRFEGLITFVNYAAILFLVVQLVDGPAKIRSLARTLFFSAILVAFYGVMQYLGHDLIDYPKLNFEAARSFSTLGNPDLLGGFLVFPLPLTLALALSESRRPWRIVYWLGFLLIAACLLTSFTRAAWIGGGLSLLILALAVVRTRTRLVTVDWSFAGLTVLAAAAVVVRSLGSASEVTNAWARVKSIFAFGEGSSRTRSEIWQAAIDAIRHRPLTGYGADTFRLVFNRFKPIEYVRDAGYVSVADNAHDYPLHVAAGLGIPGVLLLYGIFGWVLSITAPHAFGRDRGEGQLLYAAVWASVLGYLVHLLFGLSVIGSTLFLWIGLGILLGARVAFPGPAVAAASGVSALAQEPGAKAAPGRVTAKSGAIPAGRAVAAVALVLVLSAAFVANIVYVAADHAYLRSQASTSAGVRLQQAEKAVRLNPSNTPYYAEVGIVYMDMSFTYLDSARQARAQGQDATAALTAARANIELGAKAFARAIDFSPWEYDNYVNLARLLNQASPYLGKEYSEQALATARMGMEVEPNGPTVRLEAALALSQLNRLDEAITETQAASAMDPRYADPFSLLGDLYRRKGDTAAAVQAYTEALRLSPNDAAVRQALESLGATGTG